MTPRRLLRVGALALFGSLLGCSGSDGTETPGETGGETGTAGAGGAPIGTGGGGGTTETGGSGGTGGSGYVPGDVLFFDDFEYDVARDGTNAHELFPAEGGWSWAKSINGTGSHNGYLYTTDTIPGFTGAPPGIGGSRVLVMEALPATFQGQTDFYLQYGDEGAPENTIPADVWFQFWIYVPSTAEQPSRFGGGKFLYPCNTAYPCHSHKWLITIGPNSREPLWEELGHPSEGDAFYNNIANTEVADIVNPGAADYNRWKFGPTDTSEKVTANRWTLVKIHLDTSTASGVFEMWMRAPQASWTKVAEWIDGQDGLQWQIHPSDIGGHRVVRMPTTIGSAVIDENHVPYDLWMYLDDFAIATGEDALPQYP